MSRSKDYIFKNNEGKLELVADFEGYYRDTEDPWDQNSIDSDMTKYYAFSRSRLINCINSLDQNNTIVEVGCGLGIVAKIIKDNVDNAIVTGIDISSTAVNKANKEYDDIDFFVNDIASEKFEYKQRADVIIINQMLWYILDDLDKAIDNVYKTLNKNGHLIISVAFLEEQNYGKDIIDGFYGLIDYCKNNINKKFELIYSDIDNSKTYSYQDGIVCLKKIDI